MYYLLSFDIIIALLSLSHYIFSTVQCTVINSLKLKYQYELIMPKIVGGAMTLTEIADVPKIVVGVMVVLP